MIERFTEKAIKVILLAQEEAFIAKHEKLYPEHILLGILREGSGLSAKLLKASGLSLDIFRDEIKKIPLKQHSNSQETTESLPFAPAVKKILREAWYEGQSVGAYYVTPENLFLCLLREENVSVLNLLRDLNIDVARIKTSVRRVSGKPVKSSGHPEDVSRGISPSLNIDTTLLYEDETLGITMKTAEENLLEANREVFGTEQLFIGILKNKENWLAQILQNEGVNIENFGKKLAAINCRKEEYDNEPQFTPKAQRAINSAIDIARGFGSTYIKPEHVLLGILKENEGLACKILSELNIDIDSLYNKVINPIEKEKPEIHTIVKLAQEEARRMEQNIVGTEQILLGLFGEGTGIAAKVLRDLGVTLKDMRIEVQKVIGFGHHYSEDKDTVFTPRAKRVLEQAWIKAKKFNHSKIASEHLLLAITGEKESMAMKVLETLGVDVLEIRQGILNEIKKG